MFKTSGNWYDRKGDEDRSEEQQKHVAQQWARFILKKIYLVHQVVKISLISETQHLLGFFSERPQGTQVFTRLEHDEFQQYLSSARLL